jgi:hypothetical protein
LRGRWEGLKKKEVFFFEKKKQKTFVFFGFGGGLVLCAGWRGLFGI